MKYTIWTNEQYSNQVKAFKSALKFRKTEEWQWADKLDESDIWVLDMLNLSAESLTELTDKYKDIVDKPKVVMLGKGHESNPIIPSGWKAFDLPFSVALVFQWLDANIYKQNITEVPPQESSLKQTQLKPWKNKQFKLVGWPNISEFGTKVHIAITCSNLLNNYHSFESAQQWGTPPDLLDALLSSASRSSLLKIKDEQTPAGAWKESMLDKKYKSLVQKLINRLE